MEADVFALKPGQGRYLVCAQKGLQYALVDSANAERPYHGRLMRNDSRAFCSEHAPQVRRHVY